MATEDRSRISISRRFGDARLLTNRRRMGDRSGTSPGSSIERRFCNPSRATRLFVRCARCGRFFRKEAEGRWRAVRRLPVSSPPKQSSIPWRTPRPGHAQKRGAGLLRPRPGFERREKGWLRIARGRPLRDGRGFGVQFSSRRTRKDFPFLRFPAPSEQPS